MIRLLADDAAISVLTELPRRPARGGRGARRRRPRLRRARRRAAHLGGRGPPARLARPGTLRRRIGRAPVSDFVTELRREVVGAHARAPRALGAALAAAAGGRRPRRGGRARRLARRGRVALRSLPGPSRPASRASSRSSTRRRPDRRGVRRGLAVGRRLRRSEVVRIDPAPAPGARRGSACAGTSRTSPWRPAGLWVRNAEATPRSPRAACRGSIRLRSRRAARVPLRAGALAVGDDAVWAAADPCARGHRTDRRRHRRPHARVPLPNAMASPSRAARVGDHPDGSVARLDAATGRLVRALAAAGASLVNTGRQRAGRAGCRRRLGAQHRQGPAILRIAGGRVVRQIPVDPSAVNPIAHQARMTACGPHPAANSSATAPSVPDRPRHRRRDRDPLDLGTQRPIALVAADGALCVVCGDGTAVLIKT